MTFFISLKMTLIWLSFDCYKYWLQIDKHFTVITLSSLC